MRMIFFTVSALGFVAMTVIETLFLVPMMDAKSSLLVPSILLWALTFLLMIVCGIAYASEGPPKHNHDEYRVGDGDPPGAF